ncbi:hypothetical protein MP228_011900 [Amoeboaphelidium protococcarum]|nr:hypothetical protein MP228_011900 [Amoeboaphelidium protococcarum]
MVNLGKTLKRAAGYEMQYDSDMNLDGGSSSSDGSEIYDGVSDRDENDTLINQVSQGKPSSLRASLALDDLAQMEGYKSAKVNREDLYSDEDLDSQDAYSHSDVSEDEQLLYSGGNSEDDYSESNYEDDDNDLGKVVQNLQAEQSAFIQQVQKSQKNDHLKGLHVRNQLKIQDSLLDMRIRMQKLFTVANQLPDAQVAPLYYQTKGQDETGAATLVARTAAQSELKVLVKQLMGLQFQSLNKSANVLGVKDKVSLEGGKDQTIEDAYQTYVQFEAKYLQQAIASTIPKWQNKLANPSQKGMKVLNQPMHQQVDSIMKNDYERVIKRARVNTVAQQNKIGFKLVRDVQVFDDFDFYSQQLKDLISSKSSINGTADTVALSEHMVKLKQLNKKKKKREIQDRKLNKDRTIKYVPMDQLVNFMVSRSDPLISSDFKWHESMVDELCKSLSNQK